VHRWRCRRRDQRQSRYAHSAATTEALQNLSEYDSLRQSELEKDSTAADSARPGVEPHASPRSVLLEPHALPSRADLRLPYDLATDDERLDAKKLDHADKRADTADAERARASMMTLRAAVFDFARNAPPLPRSQPPRSPYRRTPVVVAQPPLPADASGTAAASPQPPRPTDAAASPRPPRPTDAAGDGPTSTAASSEAPSSDAPSSEAAPTPPSPSEQTEKAPLKGIFTRPSHYASYVPPHVAKLHYTPPHLQRGRQGQYSPPRHAMHAFPQPPPGWMPLPFPFACALPPGHPGAFPPGAFPPGAFPGAFPPLPPGSFHPGPFQPGTFPPGSFQPGAAFPSGSFPPGAAFPPGAHFPPGAAFPTHGPFPLHGPFPPGAYYAPPEFAGPYDAYYAYAAAQARYAPPHYAPPPPPDVVKPPPPSAPHPDDAMEAAFSAVSLDDAVPVSPSSVTSLASMSSTDESAPEPETKNRFTSTFVTPAGVGFRFIHTATNLPETPKTTARKFPRTSCRSLSPTRSPTVHRRTLGHMIQPGAYDCVFFPPEPRAPASAPQVPREVPREAFDDLDLLRRSGRLSSSDLAASLGILEAK